MTIIGVIAACSIGPLILAELVLWIIDMIRRSSFNDPKKRRAKGLKSTDLFEPKRPEFTLKIKQALTDTRLISKKQEKRNKWGIAIDPGSAAMTWRKLYVILIAIGSIIGIIGINTSQTTLTVIGILIGMSWAVVAAQQGSARIKAEKDIYDTIFTVVKAHMGTDANMNPREIIKIGQWTTSEEPQLIADGRTKAMEDGELEEFEKDIPKPDKRGHVKQPRIAEFRTTPLDMQVTFPATFREAGTDDTLMHLNEAFGHVTEWVAERDIPDEKHPGQMKTISGWDFPGHTAYLRTVPPLPTMAKLPVDFDKGPWNQIKLGRTVSGEAYWDLKVTPMALVPLSVDTLIWRKNKNAVDEYNAVRMDSLRKNDVVLSEMGVETAITGLTETHTPDEMFRIVFIDRNADKNRMHTVKAASEHIWPVDVNATAHAMQAGDYDTGEPVKEMTSMEMYELVQHGIRPVLSPVHDGERLINWQVYSIAFMTPEPVKCIRVDDPTRTFLIAATHDAETTMNKLNACHHGIPTHNCGSPLALDTVITREDGSQTTLMDIHEGERILGSNGAYTTVTGVSRIMNPEHLYELELEPVDDE